MLAYGREFVHPRPYRLIDLASAAGMAVSGVRTAYDRGSPRVPSSSVSDLLMNRIRPAHQLPGGLTGTEDGDAGPASVCPGQTARGFKTVTAGLAQKSRTIAVCERSWIAWGPSPGGGFGNCAAVVATFCGCVAR
ncbi:hypothetical protein GCM10009872_15390 [Actinopolymorpha rutila]